MVVVDDGSDDPESVAGVCGRHGARLIRRPVNGGPGAARNDALAVIDTELVAFVDSDCAVDPGWLAPLVRHFDDPTIGAVAPRIRPAAGVPDPAGRCSTGTPTPVARSTWAPTRARSAPAGWSATCPPRPWWPATAVLPIGFDPDLRVGEDVDLVWRLVAAGWRVRYEPSVTVRHREPDSWGGLLARRFRYGTSAGPLARRHRGRLAPVELRPWPAAVAAAILVGRPRTGRGGADDGDSGAAPDLGRHGIPLGQTLRWSAGGAGWTVVGIGRAVTMLAWPALVAAGLGGRRRRLACASWS